MVYWTQETVRDRFLMLQKKRSEVTYEKNIAEIKRRGIGRK